MARHEPRGNLVLWTNRAKVRGDTLPLFTGRVGRPNIQAEHQTALWGYRDKYRRIYLSGLIHELPIGTDAYTQIEAALEPPVHDLTDIVEAGPNLTLRPGEIILFTNVLRTPQAAHLPHFWGRALFAGTDRAVEVGAWVKASRNGKPMLSGATSVPLGQGAAPVVADPPDLQPIGRMIDAVAQEVEMA